MELSELDQKESKQTKMLAALLIFIVAAVLLNWLVLFRPKSKVVIHNPVYPDLAAEAAAAQELEPEIVHQVLPDEVRGIYWTATTAGGSRGDQLLDYMTQMSLNAAVIDLKMDNGQLAFAPLNQAMRHYVMTKPAIADLDALTKKLHERGIYAIARIAVFRDSAFARGNPQLAMKWPGGSLWTDKTGAAWVDPATPHAANYAIDLGKEAYARGFDEVQFDYVRFASDGSISSIRYPVYDFSKTKIEVMQEFFARVGGALKEEAIPVSFDVFGMTFWSNHDYNIGQRLVDVWPNADFVSPMPYPSHYPNGFNGYANPALYPYEIVKSTLDKGAEMLETELGMFEETSRPTFRPWLQDFDIGAVYTAARIEAEIAAARDAGCSGWILWNARNVYEPADYLIGVGREEVGREDDGDLTSASE
ncbi:putative glycoside hydrolase [Patescibacteria group bacterium]|nr:putative glycoside hydrolase [Patescibacteria group bacterium]MBU1705585.1 putative glycoside hydrolase [Patescibacteria group bacterium]